MDVILLPLFNLLSVVITLFIWALIIQAVMSWLVAFSVVNTHNRFVYTVMDVLYRVTEPALRPIRRYLPQAGGIDFSPLVLILLLIFLEDLLRRLVQKML